MSTTSLHYTERVQTDSEKHHPLIRSIDANAMRLQLRRRDPARIAQHPLWQEVASRLKERLIPIRADTQARMDHDIGAFGRAMNPSPASLSMIWSVGLLAYLSNVTSTLGFWSQALKPGGLLIFATLGPDSFRPLALALGDADQKTHVAGYPDMHDIGDALMGMQLVNPVMDAEWVNLSYSDPVSALHDLRLLGGNALLGRPKGLCTDRWRRQVLLALESLRQKSKAAGAARTNVDTGQAEKILIPVEIVFGHAWKAAATNEKPVQWVQRPAEKS